MDSAVDIAMQTCEGLNAAHQAGIIHSDIKLENIIIDKSGRLRILDFGLAQMAGVTTLTKEASMLGTISYMSPEQFQGASVGQHADVWAVGVVLYELLTGELPFHGDYELAVIYSVCNEEPPLISDLRLSILLLSERFLQPLRYVKSFCKLNRLISLPLLVRDYYIYTMVSSIVLFKRCTGFMRYIPKFHIEVSGMR